jgi:isoaspartyl peptidase/L-asparaginase-like protein (Ntn-hydrolase superfamily)
MKIVMAKTATDYLRREPLARENGVSFATRAAQDAVDLLARRGKGTGGLILLDRNGNPALAFNTPRMAYGYVAADASFFTAVEQRL